MKWNETRRNFKVGHIVLLKDEHSKSMANGICHPNRTRKKWNGVKCNVEVG